MGLNFGRRLFRLKRKGNLARVTLNLLAFDERCRTSRLEMPSAHSLHQAIMYVANPMRRDNYTS